MKKEDAKKLAPIIKAYGDGKEVEWFNGHIWEGGTFIGFSDKPENYRIKPKTKLVPFTFEDNLLFRDKWIKSRISDSTYKIIFYSQIGVILGCSENHIVKYETLCQSYTFENNNPCGKYINK